MTHSITPPPELVQQWATAHGTDYQDLATLCMCVATRAAQWGADQELEACLEWHRNRGYSRFITLREDRRPKPPSLKEQALDEIDRIPTHDSEGRSVGVDVSIIRRALEQLDD